MGRWTDVATWAGPIVNSGDGDGQPGEPEDRMAGHVGVVIHTAEGSYAGTDSWQRDSAAEVGSHFLTAKDGRVEQLVDTDDRSWCQSAGNSTWISVENEGYGSRGEALTEGQVEACARILAKAHQVYGVPLQVSNSPSTPGLGWHGMGGAAWGGHYDCPGDAIKAQLPGIVARAAQILNPPQPRSLEEGDEMHAELTMSGQRRTAATSLATVGGGAFVTAQSFWGDAEARLWILPKDGSGWRAVPWHDTAGPDGTDLRDGQKHRWYGITNADAWSVELLSTSTPDTVVAVDVQRQL